MALTDETRQLLQELIVLVQATGDYRKDIVLIGGLVPLLYRSHPNFEKPRQPALLTRDFDLAVPPALPIRAHETLRDLLEENDFTVVTSRSLDTDLPPKQFIQHRTHGTDRLAPIHGEFLTPLKGAPKTRDGKAKSPRYIQDGLTAEALRYLDLLLYRPLTIDLSQISSLPAPLGLDLQIPRPGSFLVQKLLCHDRRKSLEKREKDLAYIYDVLLTTRSRWDEVGKEVHELGMVNTNWERWLHQAQKIFDNLFATNLSPGPVAVARIYQPQGVREEIVHRVIHRFRERIRW